MQINTNEATLYGLVVVNANQYK